MAGARMAGGRAGHRRASRVRCPRTFTHHELCNKHTFLPDYAMQKGYLFSSLCMYVFMYVCSFVAPKLLVRFKHMWYQMVGTSFRCR